MCVSTYTAVLTEQVNGYHIRFDTDIDIALNLHDTVVTLYPCIQFGIVVTRYVVNGAKLTAIVYRDEGHYLDSFGMDPIRDRYPNV